MAHIWPSLISADLLNLEQEIHKLAPHCAGFHLDVMDGHFVPNLTFGPAFVNTIGRVSPKPVWVHLMVSKTAQIVDALDLPGGSIVSFQYEATKNDKLIVNRIKEKNLSPSITINPKTPVEEIFQFLPMVDQVLIMSVEPGYSGQPFLRSVMDKVPQLTTARERQKFNFRIGMDGGINKDNIAELARMGVDDFAIAAGIYYQEDPVAALQELQEIIKTQG